jgi:hypothetical protein
VKVKLDENISAVARDLLVEFGYDADTVADEDMAGGPDPQLFKTCQVERRLLITFDVGFGDVQAYPPGEHAGHRPAGPPRPATEATLDVLRRFLLSQDLTQLGRALCVVTEDRVRIRHG